eukprot:scaffold60571_cov30-Tisochrysis_lutea.AAC.1
MLHDFKREQLLPSSFYSSPPLVECSNVSPAPQSDDESGVPQVERGVPPVEHGVPVDLSSRKSMPPKPDASHSPSPERVLGRGMLERHCSPMASSIGTGSLCVSGRMTILWYKCAEELLRRGPASSFSSRLSLPPACA